MNILVIDGDYRAKLKQRLMEVRANVACAAQKSGRPADVITIIGVSKFFSADIARAAVECGLTDLGENRVQEFLDKRDALAAENISPRWHLIGTLQTNKIKYILERTSLIHSVDRMRLIHGLAEQSSRRNLVTDILLQVNISGEESKHGFSPDQLFSAVDETLQLNGVRLRGLMTMAPISKDPESLRPLFLRVKNLFDRIRQEKGLDDEFSVLSMGMTQDYMQAIECGATHVRIGRAIFGPRL